MKKLIFVAFFFLFLSSGNLRAEAKAYQKDLDGDGKPDRVILENEFFSLRFDPSSGGKADSIIYRPKNIEISRPEGWFVDSVVELAKLGRGRFHTCAHQYAAEITSSEKDASVKLYANLPGLKDQPGYKNVVISRTYTLRSNSPVIQVGVEIINNHEDELPVTLFINHSAAVSKDSSLYFVPDETGIKIGEGKTSIVSYHPSQPWTGFTGKKEKIGCVFLPEWNYLDTLVCSWQTLQIAYRCQKIEPGKKWQTRYYIYPVQGLENLNGANLNLAAGIIAGKDGSSKVFAKEEIPVQIFLSSPEEKNIVCEVWYRKTKSNDRKIIKTYPVSLSKKVEAEKIDFNFTPPEENCTFVIGITCKEKNKILLEAEHPVQIGESPDIYLMPATKDKQTGEQVFTKSVLLPGGFFIPEFFEKVDLSLETPHIKWMKPWSKGKVKVLFVSRNENSIGYWREIWERCDIDIADVCAVAFKNLAGGDDNAKFPYRTSTIEKLIKKLGENDYDVIFFSALHWEKGFTPEIRKLLYTKIKAGTGVVLLGTMDKKHSDKYGDLINFLSENGTQVDSINVITPSPISLPKVWLYEVGKGRVAVIEANSLDTFTKGSYDAVTCGLGAWNSLGKWVPGWEYGLGLFGRAIVWTGKKDTGINIVEIKGTEDNISLKVNSENQTKTVSNCEVVLRNNLYEIESNFAEKITLNPGINQIDLSIKGSLTDKTHIVEVILKDDRGKSSGWASGKFDITRDVSVSVKMDRESAGYREGEPITAIVSVKKDKPETMNLSLEAEIKDCYGRIVWKNSRAIETKEGLTEIKIPVDNIKQVAVYHELDVRLKQDDRILSKDKLALFIFPERMPLYSDFHSGAWANLEPHPLKHQISARTLKQAGIDYVYSYNSGKNARDIAYKNNVLLLGPPFSCSLRRGYFNNRKEDTAKLTYDPPLVPSEEDQKKFRENMAKMAKEYSEWAGVDYIFMDDERRFVAEFDWSEPTIKTFREYLKQYYKTVDALNRQWETDFKNWEEVMPVRGDELKKNGKLDNLSRWIDWRIFTGKVILDYYYKLPAEAAKEGNPRAVVGQHGVYVTGSGYRQDIRALPHDFSQVPKYTPVTARYDTILGFWYRSFNPECIHMPYVGYGGLLYELRPGGRQAPWSSLFQGRNGCFYYLMWDSGTYHYGILGPDQSVLPGYQQLAKEELPELKNGIGKLIKEARFDHDGIAQAYSPASIFATELLTELKPTVVMFSQLRLMENLGYQLTAVSYDQIAKGELIDKKFRVLLLPSVMCISPQEAKAIEDFVRKGGVVIADFQAGIRDEHGKKYVKSPLDKVFGIDRTSATFQFVEKPVSFLNQAPEKLREISLKIPVAEHNLKLTTGKAWAKSEDGEPLFISNSYGAGWTMYLNADIQDYGSITAEGIAGEVIVEKKGKPEFMYPVQTLFQNLLAQAKITKRMDVLTYENMPFYSGTPYYFKGGEKNLFIGYIPYVGKDTPVEIKIAQKAHVYDVRERKYIGETDKFKDRFIPGKAKVYACLPYKVEGIRCKLKNAAIKQGDNLQIDLEIVATDKPEMHVIRLEFFDPSGKEVESYCRNLKADNGKATCIIPLAHNEKKGKWKLLARDISTATVSEFNFVVE